MNKARRVMEYTDNAGVTHFRPLRAAFTSDIEWLRADNRFSDCVSELANRAFEMAFTESKRGEK